RRTRFRAAIPSRSDPRDDAPLDGARPRSAGNARSAAAADAFRRPCDLRLFGAGLAHAVPGALARPLQPHCRSQRISDVTPPPRRAVARNALHPRLSPTRQYLFLVFLIGLRFVTPNATNATMVQRTIQLIPRTF